MISLTRRRRRAFALLAGLVIAGAVVAGTAIAGSSSSEKAQRPAATSMVVAMVTHGDGGSFWSVAKRGAQQAAKDLGITLRYSESNNDPKRQAQLILAAVSQRVNGLAVSAPNPSALKNALARAGRANIPIITLNSGADQFKQLGAMTHVGQTETVAGQGAGERLKSSGAKKLVCVIHEQANIGLNQRCAGAKKTFGGSFQTLQVAGTGNISTTKSQIQAKLQADKSIDAVLTLNPDIAIAAQDAIAGARSNAKLATFDLSGTVITSIKNGRILFAVDQQQYAQGYLPVVLLYLNYINAHELGGGLPILTGPGFVTKQNAAKVEALAKKGTR
jgi:simple sugar transport system substrate-binding protein